MQVINRLAGVRCGGENRPLVVFEDLQPIVDVAGVVLANLRRDLQIGTEKRGAKLGDQLLECVAFIPPIVSARGLD